MNRVASSGFREVIGAAFDILPPHARDMLAGTHFLCGVDPVYAGLHEYQDIDDGRSYRDTAHAVWPEHQTHRPAADRAPTIVMPALSRGVATAVHELGHILDHRLAARAGWPPVPSPLSDYAATNRWEAFAVAFEYAHVPGTLHDWQRERLHAYQREHPDLATYFGSA